MARTTPGPRDDAETSPLGNSFVADLKDRTEYLFGSPASGRKVLADFSDDQLGSEPLDEYIEAVVAQVQEYFGGSLIDTRTRTLPIGQATVLHFVLPPNQESDAGQNQWTALVQLPTGTLGKLTLLGRADDPEAEEEFDRLLNSLRRPVQPRDALEGVRALSAAPELALKSSFPVGELALELTLDYVRPERFHFETADRQSFSLRVARAVPPGLESTESAPPGTVSVLTEDGAIERSVATPNLWAKRPSAQPSAETPEPTPKPKPAKKPKGRARGSSSALEVAAPAVEPTVEVPLTGTPVILQAPPGTDEARAREIAAAIKKSLTAPK
jgi:hypothetical protein